MGDEDAFGKFALKEFGEFGVDGRFWGVVAPADRLTGSGFCPDDRGGDF